MSTMPSVGSGTYSPGPNMVCSPEQEKVGTGSIEVIIYPVYSDLRIRATVSQKADYSHYTPFGTAGGMHRHYGHGSPEDLLQAVRQPPCAGPAHLDKNIENF